MLSACSAFDYSFWPFWLNIKMDDARVQTLWSPPGGRQQNSSSNPWCHWKMEKCQDWDRSNILVSVDSSLSTMTRWIHPDLSWTWASCKWAVALFLLYAQWCGSVAQQKSSADYLSAQHIVVDCLKCLYFCWHLKQRKRRLVLLYWRDGRHPFTPQHPLTRRSLLFQCLVFKGRLHSFIPLNAD